MPRSDRTFIGNISDELQRIRILRGVKLPLKRHYTSCSENLLCPLWFQTDQNQALFRRDRNTVTRRENLRRYRTPRTIPYAMGIRGCGIKEKKKKDTYTRRDTQIDGERGEKRKRVTGKNAVKYTDERGSLKLLHHLRTLAYFTHECARTYCASTSSSVIARGHDSFQQRLLLSLHVRAKPERSVFPAYSTRRKSVSPRSFSISCKHQAHGLAYFDLLTLTLVVLRLDLPRPRYGTILSVRHLSPTIVRLCDITTGKRALKCTYIHTHFSFDKYIVCSFIQMYRNSYKFLTDIF